MDQWMVTTYKMFFNKVSFAKNHKKDCYRCTLCQGFTLTCILVYVPLP